MKPTTEVLIIGGGVAGCSIAYHLRLAGVAVRVLERDTIAAESSSAAAGLLAPLGALTEPGAFTDLFLASWPLYTELLPRLEEIGGVSAEYQRVGSLRTASGSKGVERLHLNLATWEALGIEVHWLTGDEARRYEPLLGQQVDAAVYAPKEGSIRAEKVTRAYAEAARRLGAVFSEGIEVTGFQTDSSRVTGVQTASGEIIACQHLIIAAGAWSARCGEWLGLPVPVQPLRGQILSLRQPASPLKHILTDEYIYAIPKVDGTIYIGATVEQAGFDKSNTVGGVAWLLSSAIRLAPALENAALDRIWAGLRPGSPDGRPILGHAPGWENVTLATGHTGVGFELSAITGKTIAELVTTGQTPDLIKSFGVERFIGIGEVL